MKLKIYASIKEEEESSSFPQIPESATAQSRPESPLGDNGSSALDGRGRRILLGELRRGLNARRSTLRRAGVGLFGG